MIADFHNAFKRATLHFYQKFASVIIGGKFKVEPLNLGQRLPEDAKVKFMIRLTSVARRVFRLSVRFRSKQSIDNVVRYAWCNGKNQEIGGNRQPTDVLTIE